jgi:hypothetical protein
MRRATQSDVRLLGDDASIGGLRARIGKRAKGNPFFAEELVLALASSGALEGRPGAYRLLRPDDEKTLPPTVQGILAARIANKPTRSSRTTLGLRARGFQVKLLVDRCAGIASRGGCPKVKPFAQGFTSTRRKALQIGHPNGCISLGVRKCFEH